MPISNNNKIAELRENSYYLRIVKQNSLKNMIRNKLISRTLYCLAVFMITINAHAQKELSIGKIANILFGHWVSEEDSTFTITIKHDTIIENRGGYSKMFEFTLKKESCDPDADVKLAKKTTTGYYINESSAYDGVEFCNALVAISDSSMVWFSTDGMMDLQKKK